MSTPLSQIVLDPMEVDKLFNKPSLELTREEMDLIVEAERRARIEMATSGKKLRSAAKPKAASMSKEELAGKTLADLKIDLGEFD